MQAGQLTIANPNVAQVSTGSILEVITRWLTRSFGCWHREMSRPFSHNGQAYRSCVSCGAQRPFNLRSWEMQGDYYYQLPNLRQLQLVSGLAAVRRAV